MDIIKAMTIVVALAAATIANIELNSELKKDEMMYEKAMRILPER